MEELLKKGADVNVTDEVSVDLYMYLFTRGHSESVIFVCECVWCVSVLHLLLDLYRLQIC